MYTFVKPKLWFAGNLALSQSVKTGNPVRVIRGYKLPTVFAPETGYRYDGLYAVTKCWLVPISLPLTTALALGGLCRIWLLLV